jgi:hypothetical protein
MAGIVLLISVLSVLVLHLGPGFIGGRRATGTSDLATITSFYSHHAMLPYWWQGGISVLGLILFAVLFRRYVLTFSPSPLIAATADFALAVTVAAAPLYLLDAGLQSAMVQLVSAGEADRVAVLGVFAAWDWVYNSFAYFFEVGYMAAWAIVAWRSRALPVWIAAIGGVTALGHLFNSQVLMSGLNDDLTLIPTAFFFLWFVSTGIYLVRGGRATGHTAMPDLRAAVRADS